MRIILSLFCFVSPFMVRAQISSIGLGYNQTAYHFTAEEGLPTSELINSGGLALDVLFETKSETPYQLGFLYRQYNASGGNALQSYSWKTNYIGPQITITKENILIKTSLGFRLGVLGLISGKQTLGGKTLSLSKNTEFNGLWISPAAQLSYTVFDFAEADIKLNYQFSPTFKMGNQGEEKLYFSSHTFTFIVHLKSKKKEEASNSKELSNE